MEAILAIVLGLGGFLGLMGMMMVVLFRNEQEKRARRQELERMAHEERLAMIERGMLPAGPMAPGSTPSPSEPAGDDAGAGEESTLLPRLSPAARERKQIYQALGGAATVPALFAFMAGGSAVAWTAVGSIGVAAVIGMVLVYFRGEAQSRPASSVPSGLRQFTQD